MTSVESVQSGSAFPVPYIVGNDPKLFHHARTWWTLLALSMIAVGTGFLTPDDATYLSLKFVKQHFTSSPLLLAFTVLQSALCVTLVVAHGRPTYRAMMRQKPVLFMVVLAALSIAWSQEPELTLRKVVLFLILASFAWFFASYYSPAEQMRLLLAVGLLVVFASIVWVVAFPQYGIGKDGAWKGMFGQKHGLARAELLFFSCLPFRPIDNRRRLRLLLLQEAMLIGLLLLSQSMEEVVSVFLLAAVRIYGPFTVSKRRNKVPFLLYLIFFSLAAAFAVREVTFALLGRDASLTGRLNYWPLELSYAFSHMWLGYGFCAFWTGSGDSLALMKQIGADAKGCDNGYIDLMLQLGLAGIAVLVITFIAPAVDFVRLLRRPPISLFAFWYVSIILTMFVLSFLGSFFPLPSGTEPFLFIVACAGLNNLRYVQKAPTSGRRIPDEFGTWRNSA